MRPRSFTERMTTLGLKLKAGIQFLANGCQFVWCQLSKLAHEFYHRHGLYLLKMIHPFAQERLGTGMFPPPPPQSIRVSHDGDQGQFIVTWIIGQEKARS